MIVTVCLIFMIPDGGFARQSNYADSILNQLKIFQPFFTTKPTGQPTGLGLSLTYDIIKVHSGVLSVETKDREGSIFNIELP